MRVEMMVWITAVTMVAMKVEKMVLMMVVMSV